MIGCGECECFGMEGTIKKNIGYKSGEVGQEAVITETESTNRHYSFAKEVVKMNKPWLGR